MFEVGCNFKIRTTSDLFLQSPFCALFDPPRKKFSHLLALALATFGKPTPTLQFKSLIFGVSLLIWILEKADRFESAGDERRPDINGAVWAESSKKSGQSRQKSLGRVVKKVWAESSKKSEQSRPKSLVRFLEK